MNYSYVLCLMSIWLNCVLCAPTKPEVSFYDAIVQKCPSVKSDITYKNHPIFRHCKDWKTISEVNSLTPNNAREISCLLYFNSFTEYCTTAPKINTTVPNPIPANDENIGIICNYAKSVSNKNLSTIFASDDNCKEICAHDIGFVDSICGMSYYIARGEIKPLPDVSQPSKKSDPPKNNATELKSQVPGHKSSQPSGTGNLEATPDRSEASQVKKAPADAQEKQGQQENSELHSRVDDMPVQEKTIQHGSIESNIHPHDLENQEKAAPAIPSTAVKPPADVPVVQHDSAAVAVAADADRQPKSDQEYQEPAETVREPTAAERAGHQEPTGKMKDSKAKNDGTGEASSVNKATPEETHEQNVPTSKNSPARPVHQDTEGGKKVEHVPAGIETDNQDIPQDLEDDKPSSHIQHIAIQDTEGDEDIQLPPDGQEDENLEQLVEPKGAKEKDSKPLQTDEESADPVSSYNSEMEEGDSYFFTYFMLLCIIFIVGYVCYHNKQKILALILEGRKGRRQYRGRRPNSANYHKLDSNLEEAITSSCKKNTNNVIY